MRLIDADALIDKYGDWYTEEGNEEGYIGTIKGIVNKMPTIEERKKGKWIWHWDKFDIDTANEAECSRCKKISAMPVGYFCKWCGSDMRGKEDV